MSLKKRQQVVIRTANAAPKTVHVEMPATVEQLLGESGLPRSFALERDTPTGGGDVLFGRDLVPDEGPWVAGSDFVGG